MKILLGTGTALTKFLTEKEGLRDENPVIKVLPRSLDHYTEFDGLIEDLIEKEYKGYIVTQSKEFLEKLLKSKADIEEVITIKEDNERNKDKNKELLKIKRNSKDKAIMLMFEMGIDLR